MIKSKHIGVITMALLLAACLICFAYFYGVQNNLITSFDNHYTYVDKLFNDEVVHTIDIRINDTQWADLLANATDEEYYLCDVVIDGEPINNVAIRAKGNTSLSSIASSDSDRYSFKIKFDHYDSTQRYYGLDKLALNNLMADATYMKDYLTYDMMEFVGADAPQSAFVNVTVNGEAWGLYLGVECIDKSFLERNYGANYGELYKPDSMNFGGGGGKGDMNGDNGGLDFGNMPNMGDMGNFNGQMPEGFAPSQFDMSNIPNMGGMNFGSMPNNNSNSTNTESTNSDSSTRRPSRDTQKSPAGNSNGATSSDNKADASADKTNSRDFSNMDFGNMFGGFGGKGGGGSNLAYSDDNINSYSTIWNGAKTDVTEADQQRLINSLKVLSSGENIDTVMDVENMLKYWVVHNFTVNGDSYTGSMLHNYYLYEENGVMTMLPWDYNLAYGGFSMGGGGSRGSKSENKTEEALTPDAVTGATVAPQQSIDAPADIPEGMNIPEGFVMPGSTSNSDSTAPDSMTQEDLETLMGNMKEQFGGSFGGGATSIVNSLIDYPLSSGSEDDRPFWGKLIQNEEYKVQYHKYYTQFINDYFFSGHFEEKIDKVYEMLLPYVQNDVSAFYTTEEFTTGVNTLKEFCLLRAESIKLQLEGKITNDSDENYVDASHLNLSDLGSQGDMGMGGGGFGGPGDRNQNNNSNHNPGSNQDPNFNENSQNTRPNFGQGSGNSNWPNNMPGGWGSQNQGGEGQGSEQFAPGNMPDFGEWGDRGNGSQPPSDGQFPSGMTPPTDV